MVPRFTMLNQGQFLVERIFIHTEYPKVKRLQVKVVKEGEIKRLTINEDRMYGRRQVR